MSCKTKEEAQLHEQPRIQANRLNEFIWLELSLHNECNSACISCGPHASTLWQNLYAKWGWAEKPITDQNLKYQNIEFIQELIDFSKIRYINFKGGEPLLNDMHVRVMKLLPDPSLVTIGYNTNASFLPSNEIFELWSKFKKVNIKFSVDGDGDKFEYIRWPLSWKKIESNIEAFARLSSERIKLSISSTVNPLSAFYFSDLESWGNKLLTGTRYQNKILATRCLGTLDLNFTPNALKEKIISKLGNDHTLSQLLASAPSPSPDNLKSMLSYLESLDQHRNTSWKKIFPEIVEYF